MIGNFQYYDLSHTIEDGMITYKGLPAPIICDYLSRDESKKIYEKGTEFQIGKIEMVSNTGTYLDCPFHRFQHGKDLSALSLESLVDLPAIKITANHRNGLGVGAELFQNLDLEGRAVLVCTGWDEHWRTDKYFEGHPYLTKEAAIYLRDSKVKLVGIDSHNIDNTAVRSRPVHTILLESEILIVEHLCNLSVLPSANFWFTALPPKFKGVGTFPVRAVGKVATKVHV